MRAAAGVVVMVKLADALESCVDAATAGTNRVAGRVMLLAHVVHSICRTKLSAFVRYAGFDRMPRNRTCCAIHALNLPRDPSPLWRHGCSMSFLYSEGRAFAAGKEGTSEP